MRLLARSFILTGTVLFAASWAACSASDGGASSGAGGSGDDTASSASSGATTTGQGGASATTSTGAGASDCGAGTADCNGDPADGCETPTATDVHDCGACGHECPQEAGATVACVAGLCEGTCFSGYGDCNADPADGCETLTTNDADNCGACGAPCPDGPGGVPAICVNSACALQCPAGTGSCDNDASNGCETNTNDDSANCGGCGNDCQGAPCIDGACACATDTIQAQELTLDLFIMLDQSGSMSDPVQGGGTKWDAVTTALDGFFADPVNAGLGVGIQYFGLPPVIPPPLFCSTNADCGLFGPCFFGLCIGAGNSGSDSCNPADYATAEIEIAPLDAAHASALSSSIAGHSPSTDTPTAPALQGAIDHAKAWAQAHPNHAAVVVLATDGEPTECNPMDIPSIAALAAGGVNGSPAVKTFVIGVGTSLANLDAIAASGGTGSAYIVDTNQNVVQQFEAALSAIQQVALACEYAIPQPQMGMLDYTKVNVQYTPGGGAPAVIGNVTNLAACDPQTGGWYYDDNAAPTKIVFCPATCSTVEADSNGKVDILLGCDTLHQ